MVEALDKIGHRILRQSTRLFGGRFGEVEPAVIIPRESRVKLPGIDLHLLSWPGDGEPLLALHGLNNSGWVWNRVAQYLAPRYQVYAPTLRGHGASSQPTDGYGFDKLSEDMLGMLNALGVSRVHLAGHSWGGKAALYIAANHPERVASLILADPVMPAGFGSVLRTFPSLVEWAFAPERRVFPDRESLMQVMSMMAYITTKDELDERLWLSKFRQREDGSFEPALCDEGFEHILRKALAEDLSTLVPLVSCPVLLLRPVFTVSFSLGEVAPLRKGWPGLVEGRVQGDHSFIHSNPQDTVACMLPFLEKLL